MSMGQWIRVAWSLWGLCLAGCTAGMADGDDGLEQASSGEPTQGNEASAPGVPVPPDSRAGQDGSEEIAPTGGATAGGAASEPATTNAQGSNGAQDGDAQGAGDAQTPGTEVNAQGRYVELAARIADAYQSLGRVDDEARWAPWLCRLPEPASARFSASGDDGTHGQKLYTVYALHPDKYAGFPEGTFARTPDDPQAFEGVERLLVKESWTAREVDTTQPEYDPDTATRIKPAERDGKLYAADEFAGIYMLIKLADDTPDTDQGWIYATRSADGRHVTAGLETSCMGCHLQAPHDRLFGLPGLPAPSYE